MKRFTSRFVKHVSADDALQIFADRIDKEGSLNTGRSLAAHCESVMSGRAKFRSLTETGHRSFSAVRMKESDDKRHVENKQEGAVTHENETYSSLTA